MKDSLEGGSAWAIDALSDAAHSASAHEAAFACAPVAMAHSAPDGRWLRVNPRLCALLGYSEDELLALTYADITHPEDLDSSIERFESMRAGSIDQIDAEKRYVRKDGTEVWVNLRASAARDEAGELQLIVSVLEDLTARKQAERAFDLSEQKFAKAFRISPDAININRLADGLYLEINEGFTRLTGYTAHDVAGKTSADIAIWHDPSDRDLLVAGLRAEGVVNNLEASFKRKDGTVTTALMSAQPIEIDGELCILSVTRDISERKSAEDSLREQSEMVGLLMDSTVEAIQGHDLDGNITFANEASIRMLGYASEDELLGRNAHETYHHSRTDGSPYPVTECPVDRALAAGKPAHIDGEHFWRADGSSFPVECWGHPLRADGELIGSVITFIDITERAELESAVRRREAERADLLLRLEEALASVIEVVGKVSEMRDPYTAGHQRRVAELAVALARELGMSQQEIGDIRIAGLMHDIGKMSVPAEILSRPGRLNTSEFNLIKGHSQAGHDVIAAARVHEPIAELVFQHHERCDGSGYPRGLTCDEMLPGAKVLMVADVVEAMSSHRPYRPMLGVEPALAEIRDGAGTKYDVEVASACVRLFSKTGFAFSEE